jgi:small subunit ribosomal protein S16
VGAYDPNQNPAKVEFDADRLEYWLKSGALPSETVGELIKRHKRTAAATPAS